MNKKELLEAENALKIGTNFCKFYINFKITKLQKNIKKFKITKKNKKFQNYKKHKKFQNYKKHKNFQNIVNFIKMSKFKEKIK